MPNANEIAACINMLKVAFPNYQPDITATADLWKAVFSDMDGAALKSAVLVCLTEKRAFAPSVGEIRAAALDLHARAAGIPDAWAAYDEVCKMPASMERSDLIVENGKNIIEYTPLKFSHPIVEQTARHLGWPKSFPTDNPGVDRGQFSKAYTDEVGRVMSDAGRLPIIQKYIESKRAELRGGAPALSTTAGLTKKLTGGRQ